MDWNTEIRAAFAAHASVPDADVVEELTQHAAATYQTARADGRTHDEAVNQVRSLLSSWCGDAAAFRRRPRRPPVIEAPPDTPSLLAGTLRDVQYGIRLLRRQPGYALVAILTMALGIGATTTLFSVTYGVLLKPLPWPDAHRIVRVTETRGGRAARMGGTISNGAFLAWRDEASAIEDLAGWRGSTSTITGAGEPDRIKVVAATPSLFSLLKPRAGIGRLLVPADAVPGRANVAILSFGLWQRRFGGRADVIGRSIELDAKPFTIVGVMPREFAFPDRETQAWLPLVVNSVLGENGTRRVMIFPAMARLRPGVTLPQAAAEGTARARSAPDPGLAGLAMFGGSGPPDVDVTSAREAMTADVRPAITVLLAAVGLLLASATANVASLQLARASTRRREIAVRSALGASGGRIARQVLIESGVLGVSGGLIGVAIAAALNRTLPRLLPADFPRVDDIAVTAPVLVFAVAAALLTSIGFGLMPALHARRLNLVESLSEDGQAPIGGGMRTRVARTRALIMTGQIALTCVLLVGAALLTRSFVALMHADRGYDPTNLLTARLPLPAGYSTERRAALLDTLLERILAVPGVTHAAISNALPLLASGGYGAFNTRAPRDPSTQIEVQAITRIVSPGFFAALRLRLIAGRTLTDADTMPSQPVIVVNRSFAKQYLTDQMIGNRIQGVRSTPIEWEVAGVVEDVRQGDVAAPPQPEMFIPYRQTGTWITIAEPLIIMRTSDDPAAHVTTLRTLVREQDASLALDSVMTMEDRVMTSLAKPRLYAVVLAGFGAFALAIAGVGLFGVLSYSVAQRSREIGVRTALGATPRDIVTLVLGQAAVVTVAGVTLGLWTSFALVSAVSKLLYGVSAHDGVSFVVVPLVLIIVAAIACAVPARRAARVDPLRALRSA